MPDVYLQPTDPQQQALNRRRQIAAAMMQQSFEPLEPVTPNAPINISQGIAKLFNAWISGKMNRSLDTEQKGINDRIQSGRDTQATDFMNALNGRPEVGSQAILPPAPTQMMSTQPQVPGAQPWQPPTFPNADAAAGGVGPMPPQALPGTVQGSTPSPIQSTGGQMVNIPPSVGQETQRQDKNIAIAKMLASPDATANKYADLAVNDIMLTNRSKEAQQAKMAELLQSQGFEAAQNAARIQAEKDIANRPQFREFQGGPGQPFGVINTSNGQLNNMGTTPVPPKKPDTVTLNDGIYIVNPDGSKGRRVGDRPVNEKPEMSEADIINLAASAMKNPDVMKLMEKKTSDRVLAHIEASGQSLPNEKKDLQNDMVDKAIETLGIIEKHPGFNGAVGAKGPSSLFGLKEEPIAGTDAAGFVNQLKTLKSQLALPNLDILHGLGRVTDREFQSLNSAMTALDRNMSEKEFRETLGKVKETLNAIKLRNGGQAPKPGGAPNPGTGGTVRVLLDGKEGEIPSGQWGAFSAAHPTATKIDPNATKR